MESSVVVKLDISLARKPIDTVFCILAVQWDLALAILLPNLLLVFLNTVSYLGKQMRMWQTDKKGKRSEGNNNVSFISFQVCLLINQILRGEGKGLSN